ncbi:hypothetical protein LIER_04168 [Lithospermum erythrorhizon]|uniref:Uncharacterized protein n=1 Tax=Lithospermum erythrorhizon TaxID=34254 RepID=A0AAV3NVR4_LITER
MYISEKCNSSLNICRAVPCDLCIVDVIVHGRPIGKMHRKEEIDNMIYSLLHSAEIVDSAEIVSRRTKKLGYRSTEVESLNRMCGNKESPKAVPVPVGGDANHLSFLRTQPGLLLGST